MGGSKRWNRWLSAVDRVALSAWNTQFANREAAVKHVNILQRNVPQKGQIRILLVTEKQYAKIEIIVGGKSNQEQVVNSDAFIKL